MAERHACPCSRWRRYCQRSGYKNVYDFEKWLLHSLVPLFAACIDKYVNRYALFTKGLVVLRQRFYVVLEVSVNALEVYVVITFYWFIEHGGPYFGNVLIFFMNYEVHFWQFIIFLFVL